MTAAKGRAEAVFAELVRVAEVAAGILDGEEVKAIITGQAMDYIAHPHPAHRYLSGDYYDVDHGLFLRTKKLLTRLSRLGRVKMDAAVWVPVPGTDEATVAVQNGAHHRYYRFGMEKLPMPPEMRRVFATGKVVRAPLGKGDGQATVLAPVRDSLGDVVAAAEFTAPLGCDAPAWS